MNKYDADHAPDPEVWLELDEQIRVELVVAYHRRHGPVPRVQAHAAFHTIVENQLAAKEAVVVDTIERLQDEGLSRHDAVHAIATIMAGLLNDLLKHKQPGTRGDPNEAYAAQLRKLTAESWLNSG